MKLLIKPVSSKLIYNLYFDCSRNNNLLQRQTALFVVRKCFYHPKFNLNLLEKQSRLLGRFDSEMGEIMKKLNQNKKVKNKQKWIANTLRDKTGANFDDSNMSSGSPNQIMVRKDGMSNKFLTTRMKILNTNFMRAISEIFITDEEISKQIEELQISFTQVRVSSNSKTLNVYWSTNNIDADKKEIAEYLNSIRGRIHELLIENQLMNAIPWIVFVYDLQASYLQEIESRLSKCKSNDNLSISTPIINGNEQQSDANFLENSKLIDQINFEEPFEEVFSNDYSLKIQHSNYSPEDTYKYLKVRMPEDMKLNVFEFDYEFIMNKVLHNMHRTRSKNSDSINYFDSLDRTSLPANLNHHEINNQANMLDYNTEERIKSMKKFVMLTRKRQDKAELKLKRMILQEESNRLESYDVLRQELESRFATFHDDIETEPDNYTDQINEQDHD